MAVASEAHSSSTSNGGLVALLGQELYEDYFSTGEEGGVVVGGATDTGDSKACALESIVDNLLTIINRGNTVSLLMMTFYLLFEGFTGFQVIA